MEQGLMVRVLLALGAVLWFTPVRAQVDAVIEVGRFSANDPGAGLPQGWKPLTFKNIPKSTTYELVKHGEHVVVKASSDASASGLTKEVKIDPKEFPIVRWQWKIDNLLKTSDVTRKDGDDYPARLYITFEYDPDKVSVGKKLKYKAGRVLFGDIPIGAINYVWERKSSNIRPAGSCSEIFPSVQSTMSGRGKAQI